MKLAGYLASSGACSLTR